MHYFILPLKDSTLYEETPRLNAGLDQIVQLEHTLYTEKSGSYSGSVYQVDTISGSYVSRIVLQFNLSAFSQSFFVTESIASSSLKYYLNLFISEAEEIPLSYSLYVHPLSGSWQMGEGYRDILPYDSGGVSWTYKDGETSWSQAGGDFYSASGFVATQSFEYQSSDVLVDVTDIVNKWFTGEIPNNGFIIKWADVIENDASQEYGILHFYGQNTHTIYRPRLEAVWDDSSWNVPYSWSYTYTAQTSSTSWDRTLTSSLTPVTSYTGSGIVGRRASGSVDITAIANGDIFKIASPVGNDYFYSASSDPAPADTGNIYYFLTGSSLSGSVTNLTTEINNSSASSFLSASYSASTIQFTASLQGTYGNNISFLSGSTTTNLEGGFGYYSSSVNVWVSESYTPYTASLYSFTSSIGLFASQSWTITEVSASYIFTSGSNTAVSYSVTSRTSESVFTYTASLGSEFTQSITPNVSYSIAYLTGSSIWTYNTSSGFYFSSSLSASVTTYTYTSSSITGYATASSSTPLLIQMDNEDFTVYLKDLKEEYYQDSKTRFRVGVRERYPRKTFTTGSWYYVQNYYLPSSSYYSIRDAYTEEEIVPFSRYSKISLDNSGSYFNLWLNGYEPERFYRVLIKVDSGSIEKVIDKNNKFRIIR